MKLLKAKDATCVPGQSPAWRLAHEAGKELEHLKKMQKDAADTLTLRRCELEEAFLPIQSFKSIMTNAGDADIHADEVANVLDALLMASFHRIGVPGIMGMV